MDTPDQPAIVSGATTTVKTMADGTLRISIDIEPRHAQAAFTLFGAPGTPVAVAKLLPEAAQQAVRKEMLAEDSWGHVYADLYRLGWFHNPRVAKTFGTSMDVTPEIRIDWIKEELYTLGVDSLSKLEPQYFVATCEAIGIGDTIPASIRDAAKGRAV